MGSKIAELLGVKLPIIQAPLAGAQGSAMAIAVCKAGGLGSLPCAMLNAEMLREELSAIKQATNRPYNVNFFCHSQPESNPEAEVKWLKTLAPYYAEFGIEPLVSSSGSTRKPFSAEMATVLEEFRPPVVSFHFGLPEQNLLERLKAFL